MTEEHIHPSRKQSGWWRPAFSFETPGDLSIAYSRQFGRCLRRGNEVSVWGELTGVVTHITSAGNLLICGFPFPIDPRDRAYAPLKFNNFTKLGYTQFVLEMVYPGASALVACSGSGVTQTGVNAADVPTGGSLSCNFNFSYLVQDEYCPPVEAFLAPQGRMFMGDSITANWPLPFYFAANFGNGGDTTANMLARFDYSLLTSGSGTVVILGGTNDALNGLNMTTAVANVLAMAQKCIGCRVIIGTIPPIVSAGTPISVTAYNAALKTMAAANGYMVADYYPQLVLGSGAQDSSLFLDGIHPNLAGYARMQPVIQSLL